MDTVNTPGDAVYETSNFYEGYNTWGSGESWMPFSNVSWFIRGGDYNRGNIFTFFRATEGGGPAFRPVIIMES
jgi:hypothetical protein